MVGSADVAASFEVLVTVSWAPGRDLDLRLVLDPAATGDDLYSAVDLAVPSARSPFVLCLARGRRLVGRRDAIAGLALRFGDRLDLIGGSAPEFGTGPAVEIHAVAGPHAGSTWSLANGQTAVVGSQFNGADIVLDRDTQAAPHHVRVTCQAGHVLVTDLGSGWTTLVDGQPVSGTTQVGLGSLLGVGATNFVMSWSQPEDYLGHLNYDDGTVAFNRPPQSDLAIDLDHQIVLRRPPDTPTKRRFPLPAAILPVIAGLVLYFGTTPHSAIFLSVAALGPAMAIWSWIDDRRSGRTEFKTAALDYRGEMDRARHDIAAAIAHAESIRRDRWAGPDVAALQAATLSPRLWARRPRDETFGDLRIGVADLPSGVVATVQEGGDPELRSVALATAEGAGIDHMVPVVVPLRRVGVFGVAGPPPQLDAVARWLVLQAAEAHSPRELALVILDPDGAKERWSWARWLSHVSTLVPDRRTIAADDEQCRDLFDMLVDLVERRRLAAQESIGAGSGFIPHLIVVVRPPLRIPVREMTQFLERAPGVGVSVIWLEEDRNRLPGECRADLAVSADWSGSLIDLVANTKTVIGSCESASEDLVLEVALALAPLRDISAGVAGEGIPAAVSLTEMLEIEPLSAAHIAAGWRGTPSSMEVVVGAGANGPVTLDIVRDGPHGLAAGTTGAGKSAFLRTLVASLAVHSSPRHLNFFFVDFAAAPAFEICDALPHSVGLVSNLDAGETRRALVSLESELTRRQALLLAAGAEDIDTLWRQAPDRSFPRLLIVIDEFRALKETVPAFVTGVVDIAARGRKAGMHLILATQRPDGVITPDIEANTNFRVALRTANESESMSVLGRPDAFLVSGLTPGRGFLKVGQRVTEFQGANVDGATRLEVKGNAPLVAGHAVDPLVPTATASRARRTDDETSDLKRLVTAANEAAVALGLPDPHRPWLPRLPELLAFTVAMPAVPPAGSVFAAPIGLADLPRDQAQRTHWLDLGRLGSMMVLGGPRSGKTSLLRTLSASFCAQYTPSQLHLYALDFGGPGLAGLAELPHCGGVVTGTDIDRVRRLISMLEMEIARRRQALGRSGATNTFEHRATTGEELPEIVLLVDGFGSFYQTFESLDRGMHLEALQRIATDGATFGIRSVLTADRFSAFPPRLSHTIPGRLVMRMASSDEYAMLDLARLAQGDPLPTGRAYTEGGLEFQTAVLGGVVGADAPDGVAQNAALAELGRRLGTGTDTRPVAVELLGENVALSGVGAPAPGSWTIPFGRREPQLDVAEVLLGDNPSFLVVGPLDSGKSTALSTLTKQALLANPAARRILLSGRKHAIDPAMFTEHASGSAAATVISEQLAALSEQRATEPWTVPIVLVVDDGDEFMEGAIANHLEVIQRRARDSGIVVVASVSTFKATGYAGWLRAMRASGQGLLLQPDVETDGDLFNIKLPQRKGAPLPQGRGFLVSRRELSLVQVAR